MRDALDLKRRFVRTPELNQRMRNDAPKHVVVLLNHLLLSNLLFTSQLTCYYITYRRLCRRACIDQHHASYRYIGFGFGLQAIQIGASSPSSTRDDGLMTEEGVDQGVYIVVKEYT